MILRYVKSKADWWANFSHCTTSDFGFTMSVDNMMMTADRVYHHAKRQKRDNMSVLTVAPI
jgi:hypothetical protein